MKLLYVLHVAVVRAAATAPRPEKSIMASSSLSVFSVSTPKGTYSPGEIVSGHVAIVFNAKDLSVKGLWIDFNAYCEMGGLRQEEVRARRVQVIEFYD